jgi:VWFA-related protein
MRAAPILLLTASLAWPQFKSIVPLVIAPTTVTDSHGRFVDGLTESELLIYDNNVPQPIHLDFEVRPISLVVVIEANTASAAILDKLGRTGYLFTDLLSAEAGETAVVSFSDAPRVLQDFTTDSKLLNHSVRALRVEGDGCALLDGLEAAMHLLSTRDPSRRRILLVIAERRDRSSKSTISTLMHQEQLGNTAVYWLTYSTFLAPFTNRPKRVWDRMTDDQKADPKRMHSSKLPTPEEEEPLPPDLPPGSLLNIFTELAHKTTVDVATLLSRSTGGRTFGFLKQRALEDAIQAVAEEVHRQYIVSFQPKPDISGQFHTLRATVAGRPDLQARTRSGYWLP